MQILIPIHSFIDVITNSSTSVYVGCHDNSIKFAKELINDLLQAAGSEATADGVFTFSIQADFDTERDKIYSDLSEYYSEEELEGTDYTAKNNLAKAIFDKMISGEIEKSSNWGENYDDYDTRTLIITSKTDDQFSIDLGSRIESIFSIEGGYDG